MIHTWKSLTDSNQLESIEEDSKTKPVVLFKHSTRCGTSLHALDKLKNRWDFEDKDLDFYYLDLLNYRSLSNEVAHRYGVVHQSPQIIVIKDGVATYDISHNAISTDQIKKVL